MISACGINELVKSFVQSLWNQRDGTTTFLSLFLFSIVAHQEKVLLAITLYFGMDKRNICSTSLTSESRNTCTLTPSIFIFSSHQSGSSEKTKTCGSVS